MKKKGKKPSAIYMRGKWFIAVVPIVILSIVILALSLGRKGTPEDTALKVGTQQVSAAVCNYYLKAYLTEMQQSYGDLVTELIDFSKPLDQQTYPLDTTKTWADVIFDDMEKTIARDYALYDAALADGYKLTQADMDEVDTYIHNQLVLGQMAGYEDLDTYLADYYGAGCCEENCRAYRIVKTVAAKYQASQVFAVSKEEIEQEYQKNSAAYDTYSYRSYFFSSGTYGKVEAKRLAEDMMVKSQGKEYEFISFAQQTDKKQTGSPSKKDATLSEDVKGNTIASLAREWVTDPIRTYGDCTVLPYGEYGFYVYFFLQRNTHLEKTVDVIHIFVDAQQAEDETQWAVLEKKALQMREEILAAGGSAENFSHKAAEYANSKTQGYLYGVYPGQLSESMDNWCFEKTRAVGDSTVVRTQSGYQVMYLAAFGDSYRDVLVRQTLESAKQNQWEEDLINSYRVTKVARGYRAVAF